MRNFNYFILLALLAVSCKTEKVNPGGEPGNTVTVNFSAKSSDTKIAFGASEAQGYFPALWTGSDNVAVSLGGDGYTSIPAKPSADFKKATFSADFKTADKYRFYAICPAESVKGMNDTKGAWVLNIPWIQTPGNATADPKAIMLVAGTAETATLPNPVVFSFGHLTSYLRLTLKNLPSKYSTFSSIDLSCSRELVGDWYCNLSDGVFSEKDASRSVRIMTSSTSDIWIACAPVDMSSQKFTVTVNSTAGSVSKSVSMPSARQYSSGMVSSLQVDMSSVTLVASPGQSDVHLTTAVPGFYFAGGEKVEYIPGKSQLAREYRSGSVVFSIIDPKNKAIAMLSGIPDTAVVGSSFEVKYLDFSAAGASAPAKSYKVTVLEEDGALMLLKSDGGDVFVIKK